MMESDPCEELEKKMRFYAIRFIRVIPLPASICRKTPLTGQTGFCRSDRRGRSGWRLAR